VQRRRWKAFRGVARLSQIPSKTPITRAYMYRNSFLSLAASSLMWTTAATNAEQRFCEPCRAGDCVVRNDRSEVRDLPLSCRPQEPNVWAYSDYCFPRLSGAPPHPRVHKSAATILAFPFGWRGGPISERRPAVWIVARLISGSRSSTLAQSQSEPLLNRVTSHPWPPCRRHVSDLPAAHACHNRIRCVLRLIAHQPGDD
jgi:hypothetical protein